MAGKERLFDPVRGKAVRALPEERVRLQLVEWLTGAVGVPPRLVAVEYALSQLDPNSRKRADVVVWRPATDESGGMSPWLLAECKAPGVALTQAVVDQVRGYAVRIRAEHVVLTNGTGTRCYRLTQGEWEGVDRYIEIENLPRFP
jgi:hypothetical protein